MELIVLNFINTVNMAKRLIYNKLGIKKPDCVIFLTAPFDLVNSLRKGREENEGIVNDIHERDIDFMKKVYDNAIFVANYLSWNIVYCDKYDTMRSIDDIHNEIYNIVK